MHFMPPVVYVDEAVDFEGEGSGWAESADCCWGGFSLGIGMVGKEGWEGEGG